jgi:hypothetical protein
MHKSFKGAEKTLLSGAKGPAKTMTAGRSPGSEQRGPVPQLCFICAEVDPQFWAIGDCNHRACWQCSLRLRVLYASKACPICKVENEQVVLCRFTMATTHFGDETFEEARQRCQPGLRNELHGLHFEDPALKTQVDALLSIRCPYRGASAAPCNQQLQSKGDLKQHVLRAHDLMLCDICLDDRKCFASELELFTRANLMRHQRDGDSKQAPAASSKGTPFRGHPLCVLCQVHFYGEDELAEHCRREHETCHICQRSNTNSSSSNNSAAIRPSAPRYFRNYTALDEHFSAEHFPCPEGVCREMKFVVFESEVELKLHLAQVHERSGMSGGGRSGGQQRISVSGMSFQITGSRGSSYGGSQSRGRTDSSAPRTQSPSRLAPGNSGSVASGPGTAVLQLTSSQREQIAANLVFGELTDELTTRLQSLSLYQQRNDQFMDALRASHHLDQDQRSQLIDAARAFQKGELKAEELVLKMETLVGLERLERLVKGLADLALESGKRKALERAMFAYLEKIRSFPSLATTTSKASVSKKPVSAAAAWSKPQRNVPVPERVPGQARVLQIVPSQRSRSVISGAMDPSRDPSLLLFAGGNSNANSSRITKTIPAPVPLAPLTFPSRKANKVKPSSFNTATLGRAVTAVVDEDGGEDGHANTTHRASKTAISALNPHEFPSLLGTSTDANQTHSQSQSQSQSQAATPTTANAFFNASSPNREGLESFTIGSETGPSQEQPALPKGKKGKPKLVLRFGQQWDI